MSVCHHRHVCVVSHQFRVSVGYKNPTERRNWERNMAHCTHCVRNWSFVILVIQHVIWCHSPLKLHITANARNCSFVTISAVAGTLEQQRSKFSFRHHFIHSRTSQHKIFFELILVSNWHKGIVIWMANARLFCVLLCSDSNAALSFHWGMMILLRNVKIISCTKMVNYGYWTMQFEEYRSRHVKNWDFVFHALSGKTIEIKPLTVFRTLEERSILITSAATEFAAVSSKGWRQLVRWSAFYAGRPHPDDLPLQPCIFDFCSIIISTSSKYQQAWNRLSWTDGVQECLWNVTFRYPWQHLQHGLQDSTLLLSFTVGCYIIFSEYYGFFIASAYVTERT